MKMKKATEEGILKRLKEYGDSILDNEDYKERLQRTKRKKAARIAQEFSQDLRESKGTELTRRMKKNRRKKEKKILCKKLNLPMEKNSVSITADDQNVPDKSETPLLKGNRHLQELQKILGVFTDSEKKSMSDDNEFPEISCKEDSSVSLLKQGPEIVVFDDPRKRKKKKEESQLFIERNEDQDIQMETQAPKLNINRLRYEVMKFGIKGFEKEKEEEAKIALAIKLGAKPPKRQYINYKELLAQKKKERKEEEDRMREESLMLKKSIKKPMKKARDKNKVTGFDSQPGKHRDGVQILRGADFKKFKRKR